MSEQLLKAISEPSNLVGRFSQWVELIADGDLPDELYNKIAAQMNDAKTPWVTVSLDVEETEIVMEIVRDLEIEISLEVLT